MEITQDKITVNGKSYVLESAVQKQEFKGDAKIVILQRGWVFIGILEKDGSNCKLHKAQNIRVWGTKNGLPELVNGKTESTKLDPCEGIVEFNELTIVATIAVNIDKWPELQ
jgi:hypothetical protein